MTAAAPSPGVRMTGFGMATPRHILTNDELSKTVETSDEWISQRTGIRQRHIARDGETTLSLATEACRQAVEQAGIAPRDIDLLICATLTPEMCCPSTAARIVDELGAIPAGAMDISVACSGFVYGINIASSLIRSGMYRNIVVVGAELLSTIVDWKDRRTCVLFGDGAGAAVVTPSEDPAHGSLHHTMHSDGGKWNALYCPRNASHIPVGDEVFSGAFNTLQMNGREVFKFAVTTLRSSIDNTLAAAGVTLDDVKLIVPHQSNMRILEAARDKLGLPPEKMIINIDRYGNTSAASVPICLKEAHDAGRIKPGDLVLFVALGGGLSWSSNLWRF